MPQQVQWGIQDLSQSQPRSKIDLATPVNIYTALKQEQRAQSLADLDLTTAQKAEQRAADIARIKTQFRSNPKMAANALRVKGHHKAAQDLETDFMNRQKQIQEQQKRQQEIREGFQKQKNRLFDTYANLPEEGTARAEYYSDTIAPFIKETTGQWPEGTWDGLKDQRIMAEVAGRTRGKGTTEYGRFA
jgi:hypothetical protein